MLVDLRYEVVAAVSAAAAAAWFDDILAMSFLHRPKAESAEGTRRPSTS